MGKLLVGFLRVLINQLLQPNLRVVGWLDLQVFEFSVHLTKSSLGDLVFLAYLVEMNRVMLNQLIFSFDPLQLGSQSSN